MEKIIVVDRDQGICALAYKSWQFSNTMVFQITNPTDALAAIDDDSLALVVYNLDEDSFQEDDLHSLINRNHQSRRRPVLTVSRNQNRLNELTKNSSHCIEFCYCENGMTHLQNRTQLLVEMRSFAYQQSQSLQRLKSQNQVLFDNAFEGILEYQQDGKISYANPKALKLLRYTEESLKNISVFDLLAVKEDDPDKAQQALLELSQNMLQIDGFICNRVLINNAKSKQLVTEISCSAIQDSDNSVSSHIMIFKDITARTLNEERLIKLAKYDVLTGLSNRSKFHDFTEGKIAYCAHNDKKLALLFIDIDHFKNINDSMGHDAGDDLLVSVAERLRQCVRETDLVARIGGDEFAITLLEMGSPTQVTRIVQNILESLQQPFFVESKEINISASIGISLYPESGEDVKTLTKTADTAVHQAKADGRNTYRFFSSEIQNRVIEQHSLETALKKAIANDEFFMHYQPLIDAVSGRVVGLEALVRWQHENWPNIGPHQFIPVAEESGLLPALGKVVLYNACRQAVVWRQEPSISFDYPISVNLSPKQLNHTDFVDVLVRALHDTGMPPKNLVLELTETAVMNNPEQAISILDKVNQAGVKLAMDDFGTGYSSLNYLKRLPISKLKIDRSFVNDIGIDQNGEAIVKAILALAHSLNLEVVAEGVEEQFQVDFLRGHECEVLQGYFFSRPLDVSAVTELLLQEKIKWNSGTECNNANVTQPKPDLPFH
ncbi:MAG: EAL domain-containing protein [Pseudohongiellaceae bacterium]